MPRAAVISAAVILAVLGALLLVVVFRRWPSRRRQ
jgi:hypothetical protein